MPSKGVTTAASRKRAVEEIRATARFGGFPIPADMSPVDILVDELHRSYAFSMWIESKISDWPNELIPLRDVVEGENYTTEVATNDAMWLDLYQKERAHLAKVSKMCIDAGVDQRRVELAEKQTDLMFRVINQAFDALGLTAEQQRLVPQIMPTIIRSMSVPRELEAS